MTLFTRPRRFGKTLNMRMQGIISQSWQEERHNVFHFCQRVTNYLIMKKEQYQAIVALHNGKYSMDENILISSIYILSHLLHRHYGQKTVIPIDEYDVPLDKAFQNDYYREVVSLIRGLFGMALKTNDSLQFAVLTGCLRISKEVFLQDLTISRFCRFLMFRMMRVLDLRTMRLKNFWMITRFQTTIRKLRSGTMVIISETPIFTVRGMLSGIVKACAQIYRQSGCPDQKRNRASDCRRMH